MTAPDITIRPGQSIAEVEKLLIEATLLAYAGDKTATAVACGISVKTLYARLQVYEAERRGAKERAEDDQS